MNWNPEKTAQFWEACKQKAFTRAIESLGNFTFDATLSVQEQSDASADQIAMALIAGCEFLQHVTFPPDAMYEVMVHAPAILKQQTFGSTLQDCFGYCVFGEMQDQIDKAVRDHVEAMVSKLRQPSPYQDTHEPQVS